MTNIETLECMVLPVIQLFIIHSPSSQYMQLYIACETLNTKRRLTTHFSSQPVSPSSVYQLRQPDITFGQFQRSLRTFMFGQLGRGALCLNVKGTNQKSCLLAYLLTNSTLLYIHVRTRRVISLLTYTSAELTVTSLTSVSVLSSSMWLCSTCLYIHSLYFSLPCLVTNVTLRRKRPRSVIQATVLHCT